MKRTLNGIWGAIAQHGFIVLLSLAAISHSAWSINSVFGGTEPLPMYSQNWIGWYIPGLLMSITIDVGLLAFVARLQNGERQGSLIIGYLLLCALMAFGQFVYVASHIANFTLAAGVADYYHDLANAVVKAALWVYPLALPVVSAVYAFSVREAQQAPSATVEASSAVDMKPPQTSVKFADVGDLDVTLLPTTKTAALPALSAVNSDDPQAIALPVSSPVEQPQAVDTTALIGATREYAIRTAEHHCAYCGKPFVPKRANQLYDTPSCRTLAYNKRQQQG